jgi:XrtJ-associated TM-motif-TM protein
MGDGMKISARGFAMVVVAVTMIAASPLLAQNGCTDSPENPTAVLALVGSAGGVLVALRNRLRRR